MRVILPPRNARNSRTEAAPAAVAARRRLAPPRWPRVAGTGATGLKTRGGRKAGLARRRVGCPGAGLAAQAPGWLPRRSTRPRFAWLLSASRRKYPHVLASGQRRTVRGILSSREGALMPRSNPYRIELSDEERTMLESLARSYTLPYWQVVRAQMVLLAADGLRNDEIAGRLRCRREVVSQWRKRFFEQRLAGLRTGHGADARRSFPPQVRERADFHHAARVLLAALSFEAQDARRLCARASPATQNGTSTHI